MVTDGDVCGGGGGAVRPSPRWGMRTLANEIEIIEGMVGVEGRVRVSVCVGGRKEGGRVEIVACVFLGEKLVQGQKRREGTQKRGGELEWPCLGIREIEMLRTHSTHISIFHFTH